MHLGIVPPRRTACIDRESSVSQACRLMREQQVVERHHAGDLPAEIDHRNGIAA